MIHEKLQVINNEILGMMPTDCGEPVWKVELNGLVKMVWSVNDVARLMHDQNSNFVVVDDGFDLQAAHVIESVRKKEANSGVNSQVYEFECSLVGVGSTLTGGLLAFKAFEGLEWLNVTATNFDANTERILTTYWGIDKEIFGQNPQLNAWKIAYRFSMPELNRADLLLLEGINNNSLI